MCVSPNIHLKLGCLGFQDDMFFVCFSCFTCFLFQAEMLGHQTDEAKAEDKAKMGGKNKGLHSRTSGWKKPTKKGLIKGNQWLIVP